MEDVLLLNVQVYKAVGTGLTLATISWGAGAVPVVTGRRFPGSRSGQAVPAAVPAVTGARRTWQTSPRGRGSAPLPAALAPAWASSCWENPAMAIREGV